MAMSMSTPSAGGLLVRAGRRVTRPIRQRMYPERQQFASQRHTRRRRK